VSEHVYFAVNCFPHGRKSMCVLSSGNFQGRVTRSAGDRSRAWSSVGQAVIIRHHEPSLPNISASLMPKLCSSSLTGSWRHDFEHGRSVALGRCSCTRRFVAGGAAGARPRRSDGCGFVHSLSPSALRLRTKPHRVSGTEHKNAPLTRPEFNRSSRLVAFLPLKSRYGQPVPPLVAR
jgi:hypothetical protein